jgi:predicted DCC family thiol-disulfide oxidoreductase YuxK
MKIIVIYDGECGLCSRLVTYIFKFDTTGNLYFASRGSEFADRLNLPDVDSVFVYDGFLIHKKWRATTEICYWIGGIHRAISYLMKPIPRCIGDLVYDVVAKSRKEIFNTCAVPSPAMRARIYPTWNLSE